MLIKIQNFIQKKIMATCEKLSRECVKTFISDFFVKKRMKKG